MFWNFSHWLPQDAPSTQENNHFHVSCLCLECSTLSCKIELVCSFAVLPEIFGLSCTLCLGANNILWMPNGAEFEASGWRTNSTLTRLLLRHEASLRQHLFAVGPWLHVRPHRLLRLMMVGSLRWSSGVTVPKRRPRSWKVSDKEAQSRFTDVQLPMNGVPEYIERVL